jgi:hypothetical protein
VEEQAAIYLAALAAGEPRQLWEADMQELDALMSKKQLRNV